MSGYPYDHDIPFGGPLRDAPARPVRYTPTRVPDGMAPDGHLPDFDRSVCGCGRRLTVDVAYWRGPDPPDHVLLAAWVRHLAGGVLDRDQVVSLRRELTAAERQDRQTRARTILNAQLQETT